MPYPKGVLKHPLNKTDKFDLMVSVWDFGTSHPQTERRGYGEHPCDAKFRPRLARAILQIYGEEPILDPMCGSGTTLITASHLGLESYGVDIEQEYVDVLKENLGKTPERLDGELGGYHVEVGDVRSLPFEDDFFGLIFTSPPYWKAIQSKSCEGADPSRPYNTEKIRRRDKYSDNPLNLGNYREYAAYLGEMSKAYEECRRVLKPGRLMVVVVKDINHNYLTVPLGADTIKLCRDVGFKVFDVIVNKMYFPSYWMVHYFLRQQERGIHRALKTHEYILVFKK